MTINFNNHSQLVNLMNHADDYPGILMGENTDGEFVTTSILSDKVIAKVMQSNGWVRINTYHRDGTVEETYRKE